MTQVSTQATAVRVWCGRYGMLRLLYEHALSLHGQTGGLLITFPDSRFTCREHELNVRAVSFTAVVNKNIYIEWRR